MKDMIKALQAFSKAYDKYTEEGNHTIDDGLHTLLSEAREFLFENVFWSFEELETGTLYDAEFRSKDEAIFALCDKYYDEGFGCSVEEQTHLVEFCYDDDGNTIVLSLEEIFFDVSVLKED